MSSYLEAYGAAEELRVQRVRLVKNCSIALAVVVVAGLILFAIFRNHGEEQQAKTFLSLLRAQDYRGAYRMWGCSDTRPCSEYSFEKFQEDWGPNSGHADQSSAAIGLSQSCGSGVVIRLDYKGSEAPLALWVERDTKVIGFAPWAECPGRHLHIREWLKSLFGR